MPPKKTQSSTKKTATALTPDQTVVKEASFTPELDKTLPVQNQQEVKANSPKRPSSPETPSGPELQSNHLKRTKQQTQVPHALSFTRPDYIYCFQCHCQILASRLLIVNNCFHCPSDFSTPPKGAIIDLSEDATKKKEFLLFLEYSEGGENHGFLIPKDSDPIFLERLGWLDEAQNLDGEEFFDGLMDEEKMKIRADFEKDARKDPKLKELLRGERFTLEDSVEHLWIWVEHELHTRENIRYIEEPSDFKLASEDKLISEVYAFHSS